MKLSVKYFAFYIIALVFCLCIGLDASAQKKKSSHKKSTSSTSSHKKTSSHKSSGVSSKKSKHSESSHGKKSKKGRGGSRSRHHEEEPEEVNNDERPVLTSTRKIEYLSDNSDLRNAFIHPPESAKPWVFWYWIQGAVSKEGITADLQAMKEAGIGGAYLMSIKGPMNPPVFDPPLIQLTPQWWQMVKFAMTEADRLDLKLAIHDCDGFAVAGGPWITPEISMQKVTWSQKWINGGTAFHDTLPRPAMKNGYYKDIAVFAYPATDSASTNTIKPKITTSLPGVDAHFLADKGNKKGFGSSDNCWIQYAFAQPFTCRNITIRTNSANAQAQRLIIETSTDSINFHRVTQLEQPRSGWQDNDAENTYTIPATTARYFRFVYQKEGTEPGAEDNEAAKWKPALKLCGIELSSEPRIGGYQGKNGEVWRVSKETTNKEIPDALCIPKDKLINLTDRLDASGRLNWDAPAGKWVILRIGHTSTGHTNETGGAGKGLECDKFNPETVKFQFDQWFGEAVRVAGPELAARVLKIFHVDSWECGSQNWSPVFQAEFKKRRCYDLIPYLPVMAGIPVQSAAESERVLHDVRETISELLADNFFGTMAKLAHEKGMLFSSEATAPTMVADGMLHQRETDIPMGEFWLRSPTHDKPSDVLDAVSAGHIYGKNLIQSEAFTEVRMDWSEHPGSLKTLGDRNFALGVNRFVLHVSAENPWMNRKPGMTLDGVGLYFQRDQTWWKPGAAWITYLQRCQALLQMGKPVVDIGVFTGEEIPRRSVLPDRLVSVMPGIFGTERVAQEGQRLKNQGEPMHTIPDGVSSSANMAEPQNWVDPLRGYAYDSFNLDALLRLATVRNGRVELPGGASYGLLVLPGATKMSPNDDRMSPELSAKVKQLVSEGANVLINNNGQNFPAGNGRVLKAPYTNESFDNINLTKDLIATDSTGKHAGDIAWTHRTDPQFDLYFISNQQDVERKVTLSLRVADKVPELWDPVSGETYRASQWENSNGRTNLTLLLAPNASMFVVLRQPSPVKLQGGTNWSSYRNLRTLQGVWQVQFDTKFGGIAEPVLFRELTDWSKNDIAAIRNYSGTADYFQVFKWNTALTAHQQVWLDIDNVANIASVSINGIDCGVTWTKPYRVDITKALRNGYNRLHVYVSNTWANRLIGDHDLPEDKRVTWTTAPYRLEGKPLLPAGLFGPVRIITVAASGSN